MVNQVSSVWCDNKLLIRKSLHNEINFNKCELTKKFCDFINLIINSVQDSGLKSTFDCRIFPFWLNTLDNATENEVRLQLYQSYKQGKIYRCGDNKHFASAAESVDASVGTLRSNDTDGNGKVKETESLISKTTTFHVHHTFFVHFSPVFARLLRENASFRFLRKT